MADETRPVLDVRASARGVVVDLETHLNSRGEQWVAITLATASEPLNAVCFPRSLLNLTTPLTKGARVVIHGQTSSDGTDFRILDAVADESLPATDWLGDESGGPTSAPPQA